MPRRPPYRPKKNSRRIGYRTVTLQFGTPNWLMIEAASRLLGLSPAGYITICAQAQAQIDTHPSRMQEFHL